MAVGFARIFLIIINIMFFLLGVGLVGAGAFLKIQKMSHEMLPVLSTLEVCGHNVTTLIKIVSTLAIVTGVIVVCVACVGMFGAGCTNKILLVIYVVCVVIILIVEIAVVVMGFRLLKKFNNEGELLKCLQENYSSELINSTNRISNAWNQAFLHFDCCAVNPVEGTANDFDQTPWCTLHGSCYKSDAQIPRTCCTGVDEADYMTKAPLDCFVTVTDNYKITGCFDRLQQYLGYSKSVIGIAITIMIAEIAGVVFAAVLIKKYGSISLLV